MSDPSPFSVLGIAATNDPAAVKRGYFAALVRHPPHADPDGFRRLRAAYESLSTAEGLEAAFALAPPDVHAELVRYRARLDALLAATASNVSDATAASDAGVQLRSSVMRMSLADALTGAAAR